MSEIIYSSAVGLVTPGMAPVIFDDLQTFGLWPLEQRIEKVHAIETYSQLSLAMLWEICGIKVTYRLKNTSELVVVIHGSTSGQSQTFEVKGENEYFVGISGKLYDDFPVGKIRAIGFLVYDKSLGEITTRPSFLDLPDAPREDPEDPIVRLKGFASLGIIVGFGGSLVGGTGDHPLETLSIYRYALRPRRF